MHHCVIDGVVSSIVAEGFPAPQARDHVESFIVLFGQRLGVGGEAEYLVLSGSPESGTEDDASAGEVIECCEVARAVRADAAELG